jgi:hypothetical protein
MGAAPITGKTVDPGGHLLRSKVSKVRVKRGCPALLLPNAIVRYTPIRLAGGSDAQFRQAPSRVRPCFLPGIKSQVQPPLAPGAQIQGPQQPVQQFYVQDGGTSEVLESIVIPPKAQAPFSLLLQTEWVRTLSDGSTITLVNQRRIARDSGGRIYQERWFLVPKNGKAE